MFKISIISSSIRKGRISHRVALFFRNYIEKKGYGTADIIDLAEYRFPIFEERLRFQDSPTKKMMEFAGKVGSADGIIIVTPEYNGGYPASLKNAIDLLTSEWYHKPVAISTVSEGNFGGSQVITSLQFVLWKMKALTITAQFPVPEAGQSFDEEGNPVAGRVSEQRAENFIKELLWYIEAGKG